MSDFAAAALEARPNYADVEEHDEVLLPPNWHGLQRMPRQLHVLEEERITCSI
jgi:hypothetical protein